MDIYSENDYRFVLSDVLTQRKAIDKSLTAQAMAATARISKAYLSQVLKGKAHLNQDQLFVVCDYLGLSQEERRYLVLLLEHGRSGNKNRREELAKRLKRIRAEKLETHHHLKVPVIEPGQEDFSDFYLNPVNILVHIALTIPKFIKNPTKICEVYELSQEQLSDALRVLMRLGILSKDKESYRLNQTKFHLPSTSPIYKAWRNQMKLHALMGLQRAKKEDTYSLNVTFSASKKTKEQIQKKILALVNESEELVSSSPKEEIYQLSIDLFPWNTQE